jgi:hypothetical protein
MFSLLEVFPPMRGSIRLTVFSTIRSGIGILLPVVEFLPVRHLVSILSPSVKLQHPGPVFPFAQNRWQLGLHPHSVLLQAGSFCH